MLDFVLLGTSGMCPLPTRALSSCFVRIGEKSFLIDCGEGTQIELMRNKISTCDIDYILITHLHADHISGLMGVMLAMQMQGRNKELNIIGPRGLLKYITGFSMFIKGLEFKYNVVEKERPEKMRIKTKKGNSKINLKSVKISPKKDKYTIVFSTEDYSVETIDFESYIERIYDDETLQQIRAELAKQYNVSPTTIYRIRDKKFFKHILKDL